MTNNWSTLNPSLSDDARNTLKRLRRLFSLSAIFNNYGTRACSRGVFIEVRWLLVLESHQNYQKRPP